jgi:hypothetical protein
MEIFLFWIGLAVVIGVAASHRGRSGLGWCLLSLLISPILTGILLFVLPRRDVLTNIATLAMIEATRKARVPANCSPSIRPSSRRRVRPRGSWDQAAIVRGHPRHPRRQCLESL